MTTEGKYFYRAFKKTSVKGANAAPYRGEDLADGRFDLELCGAAVHVPADHVGHGLQTQNRFMIRDSVGEHACHR